MIGLFYASRLLALLGIRRPDYPADAMKPVFDVPADDILPYAMQLAHSTEGFSQRNLMDYFAQQQRVELGQYDKESVRSAFHSALRDAVRSGTLFYERRRGGSKTYMLEKDKRATPVARMEEAAHVEEAAGIEDIFPHSLNGTDVHVSAEEIATAPGKRVTNVPYKRVLGIVRRKVNEEGFVYAQAILSEIIMSDEETEYDAERLEVKINNALRRAASAEGWDSKFIDRTTKIYYPLMQTSLPGSLRQPRDEDNPETLISVNGSDPMPFYRKLYRWNNNFGVIRDLIDTGYVEFDNYAHGSTGRDDKGVRGGELSSEMAKNIRLLFRCFGKKASVYIPPSARDVNSFIRIGESTRIELERIFTHLQEINGK